MSGRRRPAALRHPTGHSMHGRQCRAQYLTPFESASYHRTVPSRSSFAAPDERETDIQVVFGNWYRRATGRLHTNRATDALSFPGRVDSFFLERTRTAVEFVQDFAAIRPGAGFLRPAPIFAEVPQIVAQTIRVSRPWSLWSSAVDNLVTDFVGHGDYSPVSRTNFLPSFRFGFGPRFLSGEGLRQWMSPRTALNCRTNLIYQPTERINIALACLRA